MSFDLNALLNQIGRDKGIDKEALIEAVESAMLSAARKHYGHHLNIETQFDESKGIIEVLKFMVVVENGEVDDPDTQVSLNDAQKNFDPDAMVGDELGEKLDTKVLGRIAAQTAKQVIVQKVRSAERGAIYEEYKGSKGDLVNGIVQRYDRGDLIVNLGRTEAIVPRREQIPKERYHQGDRVRALILDVDPTRRGPQIILTRSHPDFLMKLFREEVPEIQEGVIEIKTASRDPGFRAKMAVISNDSNLDPVGACVGIKGSRVHSIVQELRGERIDIIQWTPDAPSFVARALSPAEVSRVLMNAEEQSMEVIVPDDQLSYAIGRGGQNVKLACKLTGWQIDVRSVSAAEQESQKARAALEAIPGLQFTHAELLFQAGYRSAAEIADLQPEELAEVDGFTLESAAETIEAAKEQAEKIELGMVEEAEVVEESSDLDSLYLAPELKEKLVNAGIRNIQELALLEEDQRAALPDISEEDSAVLKAAVDSFFSNKEGEGARE